MAKPEHITTDQEERISLECLPTGTRVVISRRIVDDDYITLNVVSPWVCNAPDCPIHDRYLTASAIGLIRPPCYPRLVVYPYTKTPIYIVSCQEDNRPPNDTIPKPVLASYELHSALNHFR